jgi:hypothetical protein
MGISKIRPYVEKKCPFCNGKFYILYDYGHRKYCSRSCSSKATAAIRTAFGRRIRLKPISCQNCQKKFKPRVKYQKYCSVDCFHEFYRKNKDIKCAYCNIEFKKKFKIQKYCSHNCANLDSIRDKCFKCGEEIFIKAKRQYGRNLCKACFDEWRYEEFLRRIRKKLIKKYGKANYEVAFKIKQADILAKVGENKRKGNKKWLKVNQNAVRMAMELTALEI